MNKVRTLWLSVCILAVLFTGCGGKEPAEDAKEAMRMEQMAASAADRGLAPSFAERLCVITAEEQQEAQLVTADAAAVFPADGGEVIVCKNAMERMYPASITKVMTALLAIRAGNLQEKITVGPEVVITESGASLCHINPGDTLTMEQLLYGLMLPSGNDAGAAIAVHMAGSIEAFSQMMNQEAHALGATDTNFVNPHGLSAETHYTTAYDLYLIFREALTFPEFQKLIGTVSYTATYQDSTQALKTQEWKNSNQYLTGQADTPEGLRVLGGKTGTTKAAGSCLIIASEDSMGQEYISVVLKAENRPALYENMTNIIQKIVN